MSEVWTDLLAWTVALIVIAIIYKACPSESCEDAVRRCAATDGVQCGDVSRWCK